MSCIQFSFVYKQAFCVCVITKDEFLPKDEYNDSNSCSSNLRIHCQLMNLSIPYCLFSHFLPNLTSPPTIFNKGYNHLQNKSLRNKFSTLANPIRQFQVFVYTWPSYQPAFDHGNWTGMFSNIVNLATFWRASTRTRGSCTADLSPWEKQLFIFRHRWHRLNVVSHCPYFAHSCTKWHQLLPSRSEAIRRGGIWASWRPFLVAAMALARSASNVSWVCTCEKSVRCSEQQFLSHVVRSAPWFKSLNQIANAQL